MFLLYNQIILILEIEYVIIENKMGIMCLIEYLCLIWHIIPLLLSLFLAAIEKINTLHQRKKRALKKLRFRMGE